MSDDRDDRLFEAAADAYRKTGAPHADSRERLELTLRNLPAPHRRSRFVAWWLEPRALSVRPAIAAATLVALVVGGAFVGRRLAPNPAVDGVPPGTVPPVARVATSPDRVVQFVLVAPRSSRVSVVGDFNGWDASATPMQRQSGGDTWTAWVAVPPGRHVYAFVIDDRDWINDPLAPVAPANEFGFRNSVIVVGEPAS